MSTAFRLFDHVSLIYVWFFNFVRVFNQGRRGWPDSQKLASSLSMIVLYFAFYSPRLSFQSRSSGVARQPVTFFIRYAHPTGRPSGAAQTTLCYSKKKSPKNAATLRRSLTTTGASRSVAFPAVPEGLSPSGIGGTFLCCTCIKLYIQLFLLAK